jgi:DNA-directed RNA polymerase subunit RPC12/RpoP
MLADRNKLDKLGLRRFSKDFDNIESQYLNLIYDPVFDRVIDRWTYEKTIGMMEWTCAICGKTILTDKSRSDVENFVCEKCREKYNNKSPIVDRRIMDSRTRLYKYIENKLYEELEDVLKQGRG